MVKNINEYMRDHIYLNCGDRYEDMIDHHDRGYTHNLGSFVCCKYNYDDQSCLVLIRLL